jgi:hypothetical protein
MPADGRKVPGGWWPPMMLESSWIARNHRRFDVFHVHFGFDPVDTAALHDIVHAKSSTTALFTFTTQLCISATKCLDK